MSKIKFVKSQQPEKKGTPLSVIAQEDFSPAEFYASLCSSEEASNSSVTENEACKVCHNPVIDLSSHSFSTPHNIDKPTPSHPVSYSLSEKNKGYQLLAKMGWEHNQGLGAQQDGRTAPVATTLKYDRVCLGADKLDAGCRSRKAISHSFEDIQAAKRKTIVHKPLRSKRSALELHERLTKRRNEFQKYMNSPL